MLADQAFVLHKKPFKESSELVKVLSKQKGVLDLICKGSRNPKSKFNGQLLPFIESDITFTGKSELKTLVGIEQTGVLQNHDYINQVSMLYCNELLLLLKLNDVSPIDVYQHYVKTIRALQKNQSVSLILRRFEWYLCGAMGYQITVPEAFNASDRVTFCPNNGLVHSDQKQATTVASIRQFISDQPITAPQLVELNHLMRRIVDHMVHGKTIQSRGLLRHPPKSV